ncbi:IPT/TIG domain-containing protein [Paenibacillus alvei]|uniref:IPT/TIG domain-containing protein n=1 Tax=Paenibacillus alvei TaxID=44250 RepID=UPI0013DC1129|nr:IPT/TIG domain-containing protein [Paenibacillus alvei]NEZ40993.1 hypothetical protein [Paenibacillus alvei]
MKKVIRKLMFYICVLALMMQPDLVHAFTVEQDRTLQGYFQIPANTYCSKASFIDLSLEFTNTQDTEAVVTLLLFKKDGSLYTEKGTSIDGLESTIEPGIPFSIQRGSTETYHISYGGHLNNCSDRVYSGKLVVTSGTISANGWVDTINGLHPIHFGGSQAGGQLSGNLITPSDVIPPASVNNLLIGSTSPTAVSLKWTAPGDDEMKGKAAFYDIRYSTSPITEANWNDATQATGEPVPSLAGELEKFTVQGLDPNMIYYFALKTYDKANNGSALSNVVKGVTIDKGPVLERYTNSIIPVMTSSNLPSGKAAATSVKDYYAAWKAFEPGTQAGNSWLSAFAPTLAEPQRVWYEFNTPKQVAKFAIYPTEALNSSPKDFELQGWDGTQWITIQRFRNVTGWVYGSKKEFTLQGTLGSYSKYGISITETNGNTAYTGIGFIEMFELKKAIEAVADLTPQAPTESSMKLKWTTPKDDGTVKTQKFYDIRYSTIPITESNWMKAAQVIGEPFLGAPGTEESMVIKGLHANRMYYFAMKTYDEAGNISGLSNVVHGSTLPLPTDPGVKRYTTNVIPLMTGPDKPSGRADATSVKAYHAAWKAFGIFGEPGNSWLSNFAPTELEPQRIWYDFGMPRQITKLAIYPTEILDANPKDFDLEGWDGVQWVTIQSYTNVVGWVFGSKKEFIVTNAPQSYTKYAIRITATNGNKDFTGIGSIEMYEYKKAIDAINNVTPHSPTETTIDLTWTAPGDDGTIKTSKYYDIRYSKDLITEDNWSVTNAVYGEPFPRAAGLDESYTLTGLEPDTMYYVAMRTHDESGNISSLSNIATATTLPKGSSADGKKYSATIIPTLTGSTTPSGRAGATSVKDFYAAWKAFEPNVQIGNSWVSGFLPTQAEPQRVWYEFGEPKQVAKFAIYPTEVHDMNPKDFELLGWDGFNWKTIQRYTDQKGWVLGSKKEYTIANLGSYTKYALSITSNNGNPSATGVGYIEMYELISPLGKVTNLSPISSTDSSIKLSWTSPVDDRQAKTPKQYNLRYSTAPIDEMNWATVTQSVYLPLANAPGQSELFDVTGLNENTTYFFALKTVDDSGNASALSNVISFATTSSSQQAKIGITDLSLTSGDIAGGTVITIRGTNFIKGLKVYFGGEEAMVNSLSSSQVNVVVPKAMKGGAVDVKIVNPDGQQVVKPMAYTYSVPSTAPTITRVSPTSDNIAGGTYIYIDGSNFMKGAKAYFGNTEGEATFESSTRILIKVPKAAVAGPVDIRIVNPDGQEGIVVAGFTYNEPQQQAAPTITTISRTSDTIAGGSLLYINGSNFMKGAKVYFGNTEGEATFESSTRILIKVPKATVTGPVDIRIVNPDGQEGVVEAGFTYNLPQQAAAPTITTISRTSDTIAGGSLLYINGSNFMKGAKAYFGNTEGEATFESAARVLVRVPKAAVAGPVDIRIVNPDGQEGIVVAGFTYKTK